MILAKKAKLLLQKTKTTKNANKARKAKVKKVGLDLDPSVPDPPAQTANPTQIQGKNFKIKCGFFNVHLVFKYLARVEKSSEILMY